MKRTRRDLVEFLDSLTPYPNGIDNRIWVNEISYKLISEGWVKVETPREWVMCPRCWKDPSPWEKWHKLPMMCEICKSNVIHVREVLPSSDAFKALDEMYDYAEALVKEPKEPSPENKLAKDLQEINDFVNPIPPETKLILKRLIEYFSAKVKDSND